MTSGGFRAGRIITPGTPGQLGRLGLFRPPPSQARVLMPTARPILVRNSDPDLLWVGFDELCGGPASTPDFLVLADTFGAWVIDDVPNPAGSEDAAAPAWQRFSHVVDVLHDQDITLFLVGAGPLDWDAEGPGSAPLLEPARLASRLSLLGRSEPEETVASRVAAGS